MGHTQYVLFSLQNFGVHFSHLVAKLESMKNEQGTKDFLLKGDKEVLQKLPRLLQWFPRHYIS